MSLMGFSSKAKASRLRGKVHETSPSVAKEAKVSTKVSTTTGGDSITAVLNDLKSRYDIDRSCNVTLIQVYAHHEVAGMMLYARRRDRIYAPMCFSSRVMLVEKTS